MLERARTPCIYVLAGANGAGKSSVAGAAFRRRGAAYFNPDEAAQRILSVNPAIGLDQASSTAWMEGRRLLERAIEQRYDFAFETTLGGSTIPALLEKALDARIQVRMWYVGLSSPERHLARVRARVKKGGHDIPEEKVRERYNRSRWNLIRLLPKLTEVLLYDNSEEANPDTGLVPKPRLILHTRNGRVVDPGDLTRTPAWAKPIVLAAMTSTGRPSR